ncbi:hypothetical protein DERP_013153 [Dermatophagoides pteronyssinus]|uniref:Uncharacterized protein n=1 Tax=Dermatophagoides pteronyssinus TaxID=6956 RepID=A0ABQ8J3D2_DERPT|nr:hypothetical protein DERP_013153 [Dermatophagoides pteronyssinus]
MRHLHEQYEDCIGKNSSSKIFYDPNGRCDIRQNQCICSDMKPSNIDLKIFEIVLEIAFLLACLLGYKACSSLCCKDQQQQQQQQHGQNDYGSDDGDCEHDSFTIDSSIRAIDSVGSGNRRDLKSDEESILSSSIMKSSINERSSSLNNKSGTSVPNLMNGLNNKANNIGSNQRSQSCRYSSKDSYGNKTTNSVKQARRMSRKRRMTPNGSNGGQNSCSNSRASSPCYNCRIYKEVYSPSAQCKSCRSLLLSVAATSPSSSVSAVAAADHHKDKDLIKDKDNDFWKHFRKFPETFP